MARSVLIQKDFNNIPLLNVVLQQLGADPTNVTAKIYYSTATNKVRFFNGTVWGDLGGGITASDITGQTLVTAVGADSVLISDASDGGALKKALISDFASAGGDMAAITYDGAGIAEQLVGLTATQTLTNKTLTTPVISGNLTTDGLIDGIDIGTDVAANTAKISFDATASTKVGHISVTQAVDLDQMETDIAALANGMVYKGNWDASLGTFPASSDTGAFYTVSVAGTVDSIAFAIGDRLIAITDSASTTVYAANWTKVDATDAVQSVNGNTGTVVLTTGDLTEDADKNYITDAEQTKLTGIATGAEVNTVDRYETTIGNGALTDFTITHNLGNQFVDVTVSRNSAPYDEVEVEVEYDSTTACGITGLIVAPTTDEYKVVVVG